MIIFGLEYIKNQFNSLEFEIGISEDKISCVEFSPDVLRQTRLKKAVFCKNLGEVLQCNAALCEYIIPNKNILKESVNLAEKYLFDSKILIFIKDIKELENAAIFGVDCVLIKDFDERYKEYFLG